MMSYPDFRKYTDQNYPYYFLERPTFENGDREN